MTVYTFLYPVLAADSADKAQRLWCNAQPTQAWRDWMLKGSAIPAAPDCAAPIERNLALGRAHRVEGVPAIVFEDGYRSRGVMSAAQIEARFAQPAMGGSL